MKIRTINELQDAIDSEMAWRKRELSAIRSNVSTARNFAKNTAIRAGIALLYAHWEGAIKNIATYYLGYVSALGLTCGQLKSNFLAVKLKYSLQSFEKSNKTTIPTAIVNKVINSYDIEFKISAEDIIKTNSNLNSEIFMEIMATIGLDCDEYESSYRLIDTVLLQKRNMIAHGERLELLDLDETRYCEIHDKIFRLMQLFSNQVSNAASQKQYLLKISNEYV